MGPPSVRLKYGCVQELNKTDNFTLRHKPLLLAKVRRAVPVFLVGVQPAVHVAFAR